MFEETIDTFFVPKSGLPVNGPIYLAKENNVTSEQTFIIHVYSSVPRGQGIQPASLYLDYSPAIVGLTFGPEQQRINFPFVLLSDTLPEGTEAFLACSAPPDYFQLQGLPRTKSGAPYLFPIALYLDTVVVIYDDDREFTYACNSKGSYFMFLAAVIIGFEETSHTISESMGILEVYVRVFNLPDDQPLSIVSSVDLVIQTVAGSASKIAIYSVKMCL